MEKKKDSNKNKLRGRKPLITINNPSKHGYDTEDPENMKAVYFNRALEKWGDSISFMCCTKEVGGETHTEHDHLYIHFKNQVNRTSLLKVFPDCHIEWRESFGDNFNRVYIFKEGVYKGTEKGDTRIDGYQFEYGEMEQYRKNQGKRSDYEIIKELILAGKSDGEIFENADYMKYSSQIPQWRAALFAEKYKKEDRPLKVIYQFGETGTGKTRSIMEKYGTNVYRVTDYAHPFDGYTIEDVLALEEYRANFKPDLILNICDRYPFALPARYANKQACYHTVIINSNWELKDQYKYLQEDYPSTWQAILRRIDEVRHFKGDGTIDVYKQVKLEDGKYDFMREDGMLLLNPFKSVFK